MPQDGDQQVEALRDPTLEETAAAIREITETSITNLLSSREPANGETTRLFFPNGIELIKLKIVIPLKAPITFEISVAGEKGMSGVGLLDNTEEPQDEADGPPSEEPAGEPDGVA